MKRTLGLVLFLFAFGCTTTAPAPPQPVHLVIVGTTDVHGWFNGHDEAPPKGGERVHYGGLALLAGYVDVLRQENPGRVVLVDSGDLFQGTLESNLFEGDAVVRGYNALRYTAAAVGNHEFDFGPVGPDSVPRKPGDDPLGALKRNAANATFPFLSANMTEKATGKTPAWAKPSIIVTAGGAKLGIIGLSTPDTPNVTTAANVTTLDFGDPVAATVREAADLRARGADAVIVIAHMGGRCKDLKDVHDVASCETNQEGMAYLAALPAGTIDAYFAGHTHSQMRHFVSGIPTVQALAYSHSFSTLDLWVDPRAHHVVADKTVLRPHTMLCSQVYAGTEQCDPRQAPANAQLVPRSFEGHPIVEDAKLAALFAPYLQQVEAKRNEKLNVRTAGVFRRNYLAESELGDLLTDAMRAASGADVALINSGGIRANLRAGDLVYSDLFEVSPFDNFPAVVTMTGAQLVDTLRLTTTGERGILQVSGLRYTIDAAKDKDKPMPERNRLVSVTLPDGRPIDPAATYRVSMPDFLAAGGDGLQPVMQQVPRERISVDQSVPIREILIGALQKMPQPLVPKTEGRVTILNATPSAPE